MEDNLPAVATGLIPHRGRMLLIDELTTYSEDETTARVKIQQDNLFAFKDGSLDRIVFLELLAQTAAAHSGFKAQFLKGENKIGYLVGAKEFNIRRSAKVKDELELHIHRDYQMENVSFLTGKILHKEDVLAEGVLKLWETAARDMQPLPEIKKQTQQIESFNAFTETQQNVLEQAFLNKEIARFLTNLEIGNSQDLSATFCFTEDFAGFNGHFPANPILPGVMLLKIGQLLIQLAQPEQVVKNIKTAKFAKVILPGEEITFSVIKNSTDWRLQVKSVDGLCAKFTFEMTEK